VLLLVAVLIFFDIFTVVSIEIVVTLPPSSLYPEDGGSMTLRKFRIHLITTRRHNSEDHNFDSRTSDKNVEGSVLIFLIGTGQDVLLLMSISFQADRIH
jgi:hypothetical protein